MLIRLLMILGILALIAWGFLWFLKRRLRKWLSSLQPPTTGTATSVISEKLIECAYCHTFFPKNRAIIQGEHFYCCEEHASLSQ
ncbi:MAG TPA: PP0621 family protein [Candidatus Berkiella sp.]|nr:PP0621 family protein [Candidatus Berkiella sp.]